LLREQKVAGSNPVAPTKLKKSALGLIFWFKDRMSKDLTGFYYAKIVKSLNYLEYTFERVKNLKTNPGQLSGDELERWDGMATRFARASDLFLSKYIKAAVLKDDPAFDGAFRDFLNRAEKLKIIDETASWLEIRNLRNVAVHEYSEGDLEKILIKFLHYTPMILELRARLANASEP